MTEVCAGGEGEAKREGRSSGGMKRGSDVRLVLVGANGVVSETTVFAGK